MTSTEEKKWVLNTVEKDEEEWRMRKVWNVSIMNDWNKRCEIVVDEKKCV